MSTFMNTDPKAFSGVWVFCEQRQGKMMPTTFELISEGRKLADELGVLDLVRHETLTCYNGIPGDGCGHCPACKLRREGLEKYLANKNMYLKKKPL